VVEHEGVGCLLDDVDDVVEGVVQAVDVIPVERRHERRGQPVADLVAEIVSLVLERPDMQPVIHDISVVRHERAQRLSGLEHVGGILDEHVVEAFFAWDQTSDHSGHLLGAQA